MEIYRSFISEWLKTQKSTASWLCLAGGFFVPLIFLIGMLVNKSSINSYGPEINIWTKFSMQLWQGMAVFLLPMGIILATSLITQLEFRNNSWKQLHTTPQSLTTIFISKLLVILLMTVKFFVFFNIGIIVSGIIPCLIFDGSFPKEGIPTIEFAKTNGRFFLSCIPIIAIQYAISLRFKNFLLPLGIGIFGLIGTLIANKWKYIFLSPYSYGLFIMNGKTKFPIDISLPTIEIVSFVVLITLAYILYLSNKVKG